MSYKRTRPFRRAPELAPAVVLLPPCAKEERRRTVTTALMPFMASSMRASTVSSCRERCHRMINYHIPQCLK